MLPTWEVDLPAIGSWAYARAMDLYRQNPKFAALVENENISRFTRLQLFQGKEVLREQLPPDLAKALNARAPSAKEIEGIIRQEMEKAAKEMSERQRQFAEKIQRSVPDWQRRQEIENHLNSALRAAHEIEGLGGAAGFVLTSVLGSPEAGRVVATMGSSFAQIYSAAALIEAEKIGVMAFSGNVLGTFGAIFSLGQPSDEAMIREALKTIKESLDRIEARLGRLEDQQQRIIDQLARLTEDVRRNAEETRATLDALRGVLEQMTGNLLEGIREYLTPYSETTAQLASLLRVLPADRQSALVQESFRQYLTTLYNLRTTVAKNAQLKRGLRNCGSRTPGRNR